LAKTAYFTSPFFSRHDTGSSHPERAGRLAAISRRLEGSGLYADLVVEEAPLADRAHVARVHDPAHVAAVESAVARGVRVLDEGDTRVSSESFRAALAAAGGAVRAVDLVLDGVCDNAFVAARPPGHHAERAVAMGFCLFNNAAIAAAHLRAERGLSRVAILDWDVHHGNGTQHLFEEDPAVFYASLHQWPLYPGTGKADERGIGAGEGSTLNCPQPPRAGDREWLAALEGTILPALEAFAPEFVIVSAGFDAHERDPLAETRLSTAAFGAMSRSTLDLARRCCRGRLVSLLEGGYDLEALAESVEAHLVALASAPGS
jgi:acetoin utilization deacetylase AcuC-like enzyme